ncbi:MAG: hypothetical protein IJ207_03465 [Treponema sp.]|uniref:hypothetical protein n=1 Tax=Treponema sp. TaxID=166 RepID=UPI0025EBB318|nr:hypothetical protein [Treponema sp.]MBQ9281237.1 hypothetical protein [Treponema sp.]
MSVYNHPYNYSFSRQIFLMRSSHINGNLYHYAGNNPVTYVDPTGRELIWSKDDDVSEVDLKRVQKETAKLQNSGTVAGNRAKELADSKKIKIFINVSNTGGSNVEPANEESASDGNGCGSNITISLAQENKKLDGVKTSLGEIIAHELSGHSYECYKGRAVFLHGKNSNIRNMLSELDETVAVAMQNEYRAYLGLSGQRKIYTSSFGAKWNMPIYNFETKTWNLKNKFTGKTSEWRP